MNPQAAPELQLRDIHLPPAPSLWPPAPGWWLLAALMLGLVAWGVLVFLKGRRVSRLRRQMMDALGGLTAQLGRERSPDTLMQIGLLLRRLALAKFPREQVAGLSGAAWLRFLDESLGSEPAPDLGSVGGFTHGPGRVLASGPYQRQLPPDFDLDGFIALVREWARRNNGAKVPTR